MRSNASASRQNSQLNAEPTSSRKSWVPGVAGLGLNGAGAAVAVSLDMPWWAVVAAQLVLGLGILVVLLVQSVMPQESRDRVKVIACLTRRRRR
ncbi:hypothetical protein ABMX48_37455 [Streptomyces cavourensis]